MDNISENIYSKGKVKMDDKLYYEKKNVTSDNEVKETYAHAVELNYKYYRAVTKSGAYFGWSDNHHIKAADGQDWFENPYYTGQTESQKDLLEEPIAEPLIEAETVSEIPEIKKEPDYKDLYAETLTMLKDTQDALANTTKAYSEAIIELNAIKNAFTVIVGEIKKAATVDGKD